MKGLSSSCDDEGETKKNERSKPLKSLNSSSFCSRNQRNDILSYESSSLNSDGAEIDVRCDGSIGENGGEDVESLAFVGSLANEDERGSSQNVRGESGKSKRRLTSSAISLLKQAKVPNGTFSSSEVVATTRTGKPDDLQADERLSMHSRRTVAIWGSTRTAEGEPRSKEKGRSISLGEKKTKGGREKRRERERNLPFPVSKT